MTPMWARSSITSPPTIEIRPNPIARLRARDVRGISIKLQRDPYLRPSAPPNDRETGKIRDPTANRRVFPDFPDVVLSYQAWPNPRIVRPSDKPVSRDRPIVIVFNPAETT
jgi:hypothetical protein